VRAGDKAARDLFAYSIAHLTLLFAALLVEHGAGAYKPVLAFWEADHERDRHHAEA
jgi:protoheme IX farnesyltransferase